MIRVRAVIWSILAAVVFSATAVLFARGAPIETNLLALLPRSERQPIIEQVETKLGEMVARRVAFLIGASSADSAKVLALRFQESIASSGAFRDVRMRIPAPDLGALREVYFPHRFNLMADIDYRALVSGLNGAEFVEERLQRRLHDPFRPTLGVPLLQDPPGFFDNFLAGSPYARVGGLLELDDGVLLVRDERTTYAVVLAEIVGSPHDREVQQRAIAAWEAARAAILSMDKDATILRTGVVHYAAAAREAAENEMDRIGVGSLVGITLLLLLVFRSLGPWLLGLVSVVTGVAAGMLATVATFGNIHLITLVFGASLTGEAIDYSIQYYAARLDAGRAWNAERGLRAVFPGLSIALATSVLGYVALSAAPFPALQQMAVFSVVGLIGAYLTVVLLLPLLAERPATYQPVRLLKAAHDAWIWAESMRRPAARAIITFALLGIALGGIWQLRATDDIRLLVAAPIDLVAEETTIRRLIGFAQSGQFFVVEGQDVQEVLEREERLTARLREAIRHRSLNDYQAVSDFVPSDRRQQQTYDLWYRHVFAGAALEQALIRGGFRRNVVSSYVADFRAGANRRLTMDAWLQSAASAPFRHLWIGGVDRRYVSIVMPAGFDSVATLVALARDLPGVTLVDKAGEVSGLFGEYRRTGGLILLVAGLLVFGVLLWRYGWREALSAVAPTVLAVALVLAYFGYTQSPLTLFNVMALLLVLGVGVNYVIFLYEGKERRGAVLVGVLLSALTTLLSFGLLGWSGTPALHQFGMTLFIGICATTILAPVFGPRRTVGTSW